MNFAHNLRFLCSLLVHNLKASLALRGAFWLQVVLMALNNLLFCITWWILFRRFEQIRGWALHDVLALYGVAAAAFGLSSTLAGGVRDLARAIIDGDIDTLLSQPKSPLLQAAAARSTASGWGDVVSGLTLLGLSGYLALETLPLLVAGLATSFIVITATGVILQSGAFWLGRVESLARTLQELLLTFSQYPPTLFSGALKLALFTVIPAGFVSYLPVQLLREYNWVDALLTLGGGAFYATLAVVVFERGLVHYESGNRFIARV